jgi:hypothetical protein
MGAPVHESSPRLLGKNEELVGVRSSASPDVEEQRGGRATAVKIRRRQCSVRALLKRGERRKGAGRGAVKLRVVLAFYRRPGLLGVEMPVSNSRRFTADAIDGWGVLTGIQEGESRQGSKELSLASQ